MAVVEEAKTVTDSAAVFFFFFFFSVVLLVVEDVSPNLCVVVTWVVQNVCVCVCVQFLCQDLLKLDVLYVRTY